MVLIDIIALVSFVLCLACVALNAVFVLKGKKPVISLAAYGVTFLLFAASGAAAAGLPVPVLSTLGAEKGGAADLDPDRFILQPEQLETPGAVDTGDLTLLYGDLKEVTVDENGSVEIKALVSLQKKEGMSVDQNFFNVENLVQAHGFDNCQEIKYGASAILAGGGEGRVISFTIGKETIDALALGDIDAYAIREAAGESLWVSNNLGS